MNNLLSNPARRRENISADAEVMKIIKRFAHIQDRNLLNLIDEIFWDFIDEIEGNEPPSMDPLAEEAS